MSKNEKNLTIYKVDAAPFPCRTDESLYYRQGLPEETDRRTDSIRQSIIGF